MQAVSALSSAGIERGQYRTPPMLPVLRRLPGCNSVLVLHDALAPRQAELEDYYSVTSPGRGAQ
jgi:hypothetical protein